MDIYSLAIFTKMSDNEQKQIFLLVVFHVLVRNGDSISFICSLSICSMSSIVSGSIFLLVSGSKSVNADPSREKTPNVRTGTDLWVNWA